MFYLAVQIFGFLFTVLTKTIIKINPAFPFTLQNQAECKLLEIHLLVVHN